MAVKRLITLPGLREPPSGVLAALREIDPTVELYYGGSGMWWLGRVLPTPERRAQAVRELDELHAAGSVDWNRVRRARLSLEGFVVVWQVPEWRLGSGLADDYRFADWFVSQRRVEFETAVLEETFGRTRLKRMLSMAREFAALEGRSIHRFASGRRSPRLARRN